MSYTPPQNQSNARSSLLLFINNRRKCLGLSFVELLVSITLTSVFTTVALPNFNEFVVNTRVDSEISRLSRLLLTARNFAINNNANVIICPLSDTGTCSTKWHEELSVFVDKNNNKRFDGNKTELLISTKEAIKTGDTLIYGMNRKSITYKPTGHLYGLSNGTLKYCPKGYVDKSRAIIVSISGRFYASTDNNQDGIDETRNNKVINCD